jgi:hypothetical protein
LYRDLSPQRKLDQILLVGKAEALEALSGGVQ